MQEPRMTATKRVGLDEPVADVDRSEWRRRSVHGTAASIASQAIRLVVQMGSQVLLARLLAPSAFGLVAMVVPVVWFAQLFGQLGLLEAVIQRPTISQAELSGLFWVNLAVGLGLALLLIAASPAIVWLYAEPQTATIAQCLSAVLVFGACSALPMALMNRRLRFVALAVIDVVTTAVAAVVGVGAALAGFGFWSLVAMQIANAAGIMVLAWSFAGWRPSWPRRVAGMYSLLRFGSQVTASSLVHALSYNVDNVLLGMTWGAVPLGFYERGMRLMLRPVLQMAMPFTRVAVPLLSRLQDEPQRYRAAYTRLLRAVLFATTPAIIFATVMAHHLVLLVLGPRWLPAAPLFIWFGVGALLTPINFSTNWLFISQNRARQELRWNIVEAVIALCAALAGLPWGAEGVAAAMVIASVLLWTPPLCWAATREGPVRLADLVRALYPTAIAGVGSFAAVWLLAPLLAHRGLVGVAWAVTASYAVFTICYACVPEGQRALREAWAIGAPRRRARA
jgi:polysaccharide transporter, PST family